MHRSRGNCLSIRFEKNYCSCPTNAYHPGLKSDAERAVKRAPGVEVVQDKIHGDPFLSKYAPGGGMLWGHRHVYGGPFGLGGTKFPGMEPAGDFPIHIIVKNGHIMLFGVVDNDSDKSVAEIRAREVPGSFGVENNLVVGTDAMQIEAADGTMTIVTFAPPSKTP